MTDLADFELVIVVVRKSGIDWSAMRRSVQVLISLAAVICSSVALPYSMRAWACNEDSIELGAGPLGCEQGYFCQIRRVPQNVVFFDYGERSGPLVRVVGSGDEIPGLRLQGIRLPEGFLHRPAQLLEPGEYGALIGRALRFEVVEGRDEEPPEQPQLERAHIEYYSGGPECGEQFLLRLDFAAEVIDNFEAAPPSTFAIFIGPTAMSVETADVARLWVPRDIDGEVWAAGKRAWFEDGAFVSVSAVDFAGNISERSPAIPVEVGDIEPWSVLGCN